MGKALYRACLAMAFAMAAGCGIRQAVYAPQGFQEIEDDGSFFHDEAGITVHLPILVVNKSDVTLHPSITIVTHGHEVRVVSAHWWMDGKDVVPITPIDSSKPVDASAPLNLHWNVKALGKAVPVLGATSSIRLVLLVDGEPREVRIDLTRRDRI